jgi:hypothetical protein
MKAMPTRMPFHRSEANIDIFAAVRGVIAAVPRDPRRRAAPERQRRRDPSVGTANARRKWLFVGSR